MAGNLYTRNGHNMFEMSSLIQKAIRRRDKDLACYAANELMPRFRNYLWKRLLCVSAEDCFDLVTNKIVALKHADDSQGWSKKSPMFIEKALGVLIFCRKNRDSDYFACNLLNSRDAKRETVYGIIPKGESNCYTKNGHDMFVTADLMNLSIERCDSVNAGYFANELMVRYRPYLWKRLIAISNNIYDGCVTHEIISLKKADEMQPKAPVLSSIFVAKAITILMKVIHNKGCRFYCSDFNCPELRLSDYDNKRMMIPDYVFDCHTSRGKGMGRTKRDFFNSEQAALTPHVEGWYDGLSWDRFFYLTENGFYDKDKIAPRPDDDRMKEIESGCVQKSLFD